MKNSYLEYSIIIPVYNSQDNLEKLHLRLTQTLSKISKKYEIIFINDNSPDKSWEVLNKIYQKDKNVKIINLMRNFGQHNAIICGMNQAHGDFIITMDDDLQNPPEEIPKLIKKIQEGYDLIYGKYRKKGHNLFRNFSTKFINYALSIITKQKVEITAFRIIRQEVIQNIIKFKNFNVNIDFLLSNIVGSTKTSWCLVRHDLRLTGKSGYSLKKLISFTTNLVLNFSVFPLKIASILGLSFAFLSLIITIILLIMHFMNIFRVSGWVSIIISITFFSGLILFVLGIIGEYLSRIYYHSIGKPQYIIREFLSKK